MSSWSKVNQTSSGFAEVLTSDATGTAYGYRVVGAKPGPLLAVVGICPTAGQVFDRLLSIPTLPWMRGNLVMLRLDALDNLFGELADLQSIGPVDQTVVLPWADAATSDPLMVRRSYQSVLRACANLGMISGRGVR